ncbi:MAG TPA: D-galactonate transporter [Cyanobacteria bacterium UBA11149]|nr:D-galactonate transporter [Cyanobacteria bacterium UBA11367]HBE57307.1 D-galactonate transporter [Cyanobacteria bacterium UBA11366]HBR77236.1 D-galactonate transporter [Cyanobacteria bacterium UBA11159]HBS67666.1 D-galactonate transporter [Cyanobacteria bacterium UBA11153]HBW92159.1 D-galactonate transporter [Cyanobacteria bacterium UBA11149]HCA96141.1 D-galactonate transporter [Cyanobacteria bacterium UBA9226]
MFLVVCFLLLVLGFWFSVIGFMLLILGDFCFFLISN